MDKIKLGGTGIFTILTIPTHVRWNKGLVQNWEKGTSRLYIVTLLTYMQSTSCEMLGYMHHTQALLKTGRRNINSLRYADDTTLRQKVKRN